MQVAEKAAKIKKQATEWAQVPCHMRLLLIAAALSAQLATLLFAFMGSRCLESVEVRGRWAEPIQSEGPRSRWPLGSSGLSSLAGGAQPSVPLPPTPREMATRGPMA